MKRISAILAAILMLILLFSVTGCSGKADASLTGTWKCEDVDNAITTVYVLNDDGTGAYTMTVGGQDTTYELKYEVQDGHLLVTYVNNEIFTEDDVFDNEFRFENDNTIVIKDSFGEEMTYIRQ